MLKTLIYFVLLIVAILSLCACGAKPPLTPDEVFTAEYRRISAEKAHEMMSNTVDYILIDVRAREEFAEGHIENAILIPYDEIAQRAEAELKDKNAVILIYCRSGRRSEIAANALVELGYTQVYDFGGINDWTYE